MNLNNQETYNKDLKLKERKSGSRKKKAENIFLRTETTFCSKHPNSQSK